MQVTLPQGNAHALTHHPQGPLFSYQFPNAKNNLHNKAQRQKNQKSPKRYISVFKFLLFYCFVFLQSCCKSELYKTSSGHPTHVSPNSMKTSGPTRRVPHPLLSLCTDVSFRLHWPRVNRNVVAYGSRELSTLSSKVRASRCAAPRILRASERVSAASALSQNQRQRPYHLDLHNPH